MDNNARHKVQENPQTEIALLMVNSQYKQAWSLLAHAKDVTTDLSFMRATCAFKLREHH
jgi:hypothetical protein